MAETWKIDELDLLCISSEKWHEALTSDCPEVKSLCCHFPVGLSGVRVRNISLMVSIL